MYTKIMITYLRYQSQTRFDGQNLRPWQIHEIVYFSPGAFLLFDADVSSSILRTLTKY